MFAVLRWPSGWPSIELVKLAVMMVATAVLVLFAQAVVTVTGRVAGWVVRVVLVMVVAIALYGILKGGCRRWRCTCPSTGARRRSPGSGSGSASLLSGR
ncbi:MAG: hypothetical protein ACLP0J_22030 [Solirubrobacteraceae bacterium]